MTKEQAYQEVESKMQDLKVALFQMKKIHDPRTFGITELAEHLDDCLFDLQADVFDEE